MAESPIQLPKTALELNEIKHRVERLLQSSGDALVAVSAHSQTVENTLLPFHEAQSEAAALQTGCTFPAMVGMKSEIQRFS